MAAVLFAGSLLNSASALELEDDGKASDCVKSATSWTFEDADAWGDHPNDNLNLYLDIYMAYYENCLNN